MHTPPADLPESALRQALEAGWSLRATALEYRAVGFGSHHWELTEISGTRYFVSVDDLRTRRFRAGEPFPAVYGRLRAALAAAQALRASGRDFVVAPLPAGDGEPLTWLGDTFAVAVYPFVTGESFSWGDYSPEHRRAVFDLIVAVHSAPPEVIEQARVDDYAVQLGDAITAVLDADADADPGLGPYAVPAVELLAAHAPGVRRVLSRYEKLVAGAGSPGLVLTHGEPHPGNSMRHGAGWLLIDWDTTLAAPPERDLWDLDPGDGSLLTAYAEATGTTPRPDLLGLYRLRWDLTEIAVGLARFRAPHGTTADDEETWTILEETVPRVTA